jgi:hypothetical protein
MYWAVIGLGTVAVLAAAGTGFVLAGPAAAVTVLGIGVLAGLAIVLAMP